MSPATIGTIIGIAGSLLGIGGVVYAVDQHEKANRIQRDYRSKVGAWEAMQEESEAAAADLVARLAVKNDQVRYLSTEHARRVGLPDGQLHADGDDDPLGPMAG